MDKTLDDYLEQTPRIARESALLIANTTAMMRLLLAKTCQCSADQVPIELAYNAALEAIGDCRNFDFYDKLRTEHAELQALIDTEKAKKEAKRVEQEARREQKRADFDIQIEKLTSEKY